jgi:hypothetical protein
MAHKKAKKASFARKHPRHRTGSKKGQFKKKK